MFRGKESSNRIELSRLVQDLLNFGVLGFLRLWGWVVGVWGLGVGVWGLGCGWGDPTHMHMHAHACTHIYTLNMIISIANGSPHWGNPWEFPMMSYAHVCACMHVYTCACVWGHPLTTPTPIHPPPTPREDPRNQSKFNSPWTNRDISILFEDLKSVETSSPMDGCIVWWVGGWGVGQWVGSGQNTKNVINLDLIEIIQFRLKIYDL